MGQFARPAAPSATLAPLPLPTAPAATTATCLLGLARPAQRVTSPTTTPADARNAQLGVLYALTMAVYVRLAVKATSTSRHSRLASAAAQTDIMFP